MCGRYRTPDEKEIRPSEAAEVLFQNGKRLVHWGVKLSYGPLIINARSETAVSKPLFRNAMQKGRCIVEASSFYEWDKNKRCHIFMPHDSGTLYMAALMVPSNDGTERFVILTQAAHGHAKDVHPRMPCLLPTAEYRQLWLQDDSLAPHLLNEVVPLDIQIAHMSNEQMDMFTS